MLSTFGYVNCACRRKNTSVALYKSATTELLVIWVASVNPSGTNLHYQCMLKTCIKVSILWTISV